MSVYLAETVMSSSDSSEEEQTDDSEEVRITLDHPKTTLDPDPSPVYPLIVLSCHFLLATIIWPLNQAMLIPWTDH